MAAIFLTLGLLFCSCKKNPVVPPTDEPHNPRNYTWVRDTLGDGSFQSSLTSIWGSSPNDVYVCGHSSYQSAGKIWHWNGAFWTDYTFIYYNAFQNYDPIYWDPVQIFGFGQSDVWIVGKRDTSTTLQQTRNGFALHYTGTGWTSFPFQSALGFYSVGGLSSSDLWVGGIGQIHHYDGQTWQTTAFSDSITVFTIKVSPQNDVYSAGWVLNQTPLLIHYRKWNGSSWSLVESRYENDPEPGFLISFDFIDGVMYSLNYHTINKRISAGLWQQVFYDSNTDVGTIAAFGATNAFALGWMADHSEAAFHYDGSNWQKIGSLNRPNGTIIRAR